MSRLNKQLLDIITEIQRDEHRNGTTSDEERIVQIHSAFTDAYHMQPKISAKPEQSGSHDSVVKKSEGTTIRVGEAPAMTGQEWYDKFKKELIGKVFPYDTDDKDVIRTIYEMQAAAKRAAGLGDKE